MNKFNLTLINILIPLLLVSLIIYYPLVNAQSEPPNDGNWTIDDTVTISDREIVLNGDLIIENGGVLNLYNVDLKLNCKSDREYKIKVESGGRINVYDSKISSNTNHKFVLNVDSEGEVNLYNSTMIEYTTHDLFSVEQETMWIIIISILILMIVIFIIVIIFYRISKSKRKIMTTTIESLVGEEGVVVKTVKPNSFAGNVRVRSQVWSATSDETIRKDEKVKVVEIEGINLIVEKLNDQD